MLLVVGGGPAGSTCARELQRNGLDVMVIDKAIFPRDKVCAGWITPTVVKTLDIDLDDYGKQHILQPITGFKVGILGKAQSEIRYQTAVSYGIRRIEFDDYLLRRSGARLRLGENVKSIERREGSWLVNGTISTPLIVGAGGNACPVARHIGSKIGGGRESGHRQGNRISDESATGREMHHSRRHAGIVFLQRSQGLWLVSAQRRLSQPRFRARRYPSVIAASGGVL
jgi:flavin-dependent dehydrogenase